MPGKIQKDIPVPNETDESPITGVSAPVNGLVNITEHEDFAVQVTYGAGAVGGDELSLEASLDGTNYSTITGTEQAMDPAGGSHVWNVSDAHFRFLRVVIPGAATPITARFVGEHDWD